MKAMRSLSVFGFLLCLTTYVSAESTAESEAPLEAVVPETEEVSTVIEVAEEVDESVIDEEAEMEQVIVTGSRIRRNTFTSMSPIQVISGAGSREIGLIDTASILQGANQATGTQIDSTFSGFVLDNGPGSSQLNLRGLGPERTLVLLNSKRLAPAGIGGAPTSPDLNTIPSILVERYELLLDGASSIYGSDAVAGVVNVIMRKDFEGFEFEFSKKFPKASFQGEKSLALAWGAARDNWNIGVAAEFFDRGTVQLKDRPFTQRCDRFLYVDENGRKVGNHLGLSPGTTVSDCKLSTINRVFVPVGYGNIWATPGTTNIGIPNFSETELPVGFAVFNSTIIPTDRDGDGVPDIGLVDPDGDGLTSVDLQTPFFNQDLSDRNRSGDFVSNLDRVNIYSYGEYDLGDENNTSLYYELLFSKRESKIFSTGATIFPDVPANNPYNPCNQSATNGVNCLGFFGFNFGSQVVTPIVGIQGDRDNNDAQIDQLRWVAGVTGDLPWIANDSGLSDWSYDVYLSHTKSTGRDKQFGILEEQLLYSLSTSRVDPATNEVVCGDADNACVPINLFASSIYQPGGGTFATQAERDYVFGVRSFNTEVKQTIYSFIAQGEIFNLPWNDTSVPLVFGLEYRKDEIDSDPNSVARDGSFIAFFKDGGAVGDRSIKEVFFETELQLFTDEPFAEEWSVNFAARWTEESTYGSDITYSAKSTYTPFDGLTFRGTHGTSYRAPNAREQFLVGQSGFNTITDPCVVPEAARIPAINPNDPATYDPTKETRVQSTLEACTRAGVDPISLGLDGTLNRYSVEIISKGGQQVQLGIQAETSTSSTLGIVLDQHWSDDYELKFSATLFDIEVKDSIAKLSGQFVINRCFTGIGVSQFCRFSNRDPVTGLLNLIDSSFINISTETSRGIDFNMYFQKDFIVFDRNLDLEIDLRMVRILENDFIFEGIKTESAGTPRVPEWKGTFRLNAKYDDFVFNWAVKYISGENDFTEDFAVNAPCEYTGLTCRPVVRTDYYTKHDISVSWVPEEWKFTIGINNLFDVDPPLVDGDARGTQFNNVPLGAGYDLFGKMIFIQIAKEF